MSDGMIWNILGVSNRTGLPAKIHHDMRTEAEISRDKLFKKLCKKAGKTMIEHHMIEEGDRILAGISGGKDSFILLEILANTIRTLPFHVDMAAIHVAVEDIGYSINQDYLRDFCDNQGIPLILRTVSVYPERTSKSPCFICSWQRRKAIFNVTREDGFNKLAFGHHRDDALETFMLNLLYHGSISSLPYSLSMFGGRVHLIRPLLDLWEHDLQDYAGLRNLLKEEKTCPWESETKRRYVREVIENVQRSNSNSKINMFRALGNRYEEYLPEKPKK